MSLIAVNDLNFIELVSSVDKNITGGDRIDLIMGLFPIGMLPGIDILNPGNDDDTTTDNGTVNQDSQATASFSSDKDGSIETYTYSN